MKIQKERDRKFCNNRNTWCIYKVAINYSVFAIVTNAVEKSTEVWLEVLITFTNKYV